MMARQQRIGTSTVKALIVGPPLTTLRASSLHNIYVSRSRARHREIGSRSTPALAPLPSRLKPFKHLIKGRF